jgi:hypothetical protein
VLLGSERREEGQARDRQVGPFSHEGKCVLHPPVRDLESRIDQDDVGHAGTASLAGSDATREASTTISMETTIIRAIFAESQGGKPFAQRILPRSGSEGSVDGRFSVDSRPDNRYNTYPSGHHEARFQD